MQKMAEASGVGSSSTQEGVVRNSALSFLAAASTQPAAAQQNGAGPQDTEQMLPADRLVPAGLKALCEACSKLYPDQPNPLQVTTKLKYWLGGQDPLDYISMYWNAGKLEENIPPHWHYISLGLSDLHGDGRVHPPPDRVLVTSPHPPPSGYGLELSMRVSAAHTKPPLWPAQLLHHLARYVFTTGNKVCAGDHISWHSALDAGGGRVRHLLVAADPQLPTIYTPHGTVDFLQLVGCTSRELRAAQRGSGFGVLRLIAEDPDCGGSWWVTRVERRRSARGVTSRRVVQPAELAGVSALFSYRHYTQSNQSTEEPSGAECDLTESVSQQIKDTLQRGLSSMSTERTGPEGHMSTDSFEMSSIERALPDIPDLMQGSWRGEDSTEYLDGVHLVMNLEAASLLPLAIDGRVLHGRHFTWRCGLRAVTVLPPSVTGAATTARRPYALKGMWLQILIPKELALDMSRQVAPLAALSETDSESNSDGDKCERDRVTLPLTLAWPNSRLKISVVNDEDIIL